MKRSCLIILWILAAASTPAGTAIAQDAPAPYMTRFSARHVAGAGVGRTSSFSSLDWFLPLSAESEDSMWFGDFRGLLFNDAEFGSNVGTGYRWFFEDQNRIYGINGYWDTRNDNSLLFNQAGIGIESLGEIFDFRANGYTPAVNDTYQQGHVFFVGNSLGQPSTAALSGVDAEAGINLPSIFELSARIFGGGYYFDSNHTTEARGWRLRVEVAFRDDIVSGVSVQNDDLFGQTINAMVELRNVFYHHTTPARRSMRHKFRRANGSGDGRTVRHRLADPVHRQQNIVLKHLNDILTTSGGAPLTFVHVVPGGVGTGTFEDPYGTISNAMLDPLAPTSVIYTPFGGTFNENVTMVAGARLFSNGPSPFFDTNVGSVALPYSGVSSSLTALPASIVGNVTLASDSTLSGFDVQGGVNGAGISTVSLTSNRIRSAPGDALSLTSSDGITISNLLISTPAQRGIVLDDTSASLSAVTIQNPGNTAFEINTAANDRTVTATGLTITSVSPNPITRGLEANVTGAGDLTLDVTSSTISTQLDAVNVTTQGGSTGDLNLRFSGLTVSSTTGAGIVVDGFAGAGTAFVTAFSGSTVSKAATGGVSFDTVTFDANPALAGIQQVSASTLIVGATTADITGPGLSITNSTGVLNLGVVNIFNNSGAGLFVSNSPGLTLRSATGSTIDTQLGAAMDLENVTTNLTFTSLKSEISPGANHGIHLNNVRGPITSSTTSIVDAQSSSILIENIAAPVNTLTPKLGALTIESLFDNTEATNIQLPGVTAGIVQPIYTTLNVIFP